MFGNLDTTDKSPDLTDERLQPGAYVTDGRRLYEVLQADHKLAALQDCKSDAATSIESWRLCVRPWRLAQRAPCAPEYVGG